MGSEVAKAASGGGGGGSSGSDSGRSGGGFDGSGGGDSSSSVMKRLIGTAKTNIANGISGTKKYTTAGQAGWNDTSAMLKKLGITKYATGGLSRTTGLAWLDGTSSEPEYVLNARQTDAFLKLADVLPSMMGSNANTQNNTFGSTYVNLSVNLDSVNPDYDVDRMVDLLKDKLYDAGSYRNVNSLSFIR